MIFPVHGDHCGPDHTSVFPGLLRWLLTRLSPSTWPSYNPLCIQDCSGSLKCYTPLRSLLWPGGPVSPDLWLLHALGAATSLTYLMLLWLHWLHFCSLKCQVCSHLRVYTVFMPGTLCPQVSTQLTPCSLQLSAQFSLVRVAIPEYSHPILTLSLPFNLIYFFFLHAIYYHLKYCMLTCLFVVCLSPTRMWAPWGKKPPSPSNSMQ